MGMGEAGLGGHGGGGGWVPTHVQDQHLEAEVVRATSEILCNAASYSLKAVELANTLRARLGTKVGLF
jgi:hypothetical protein